MAKFLHSGDIHLDSAFAELPQDKQREKRAEQRNLFSKLIDVANNEDVDILILAGDIFDSYPVYPETEESFIRDLTRAKAKVFITPGNHDPLSANSPYKRLSFPENVHIFSSTALSPVKIPELSVCIYGAAYTSEVFDERILNGFKVENDDFINIVILHSNLYTDGCCPVSAAEIAESGADYIALAHVHMPTEVLKSSRTHYAYCGCLEPRDFGECYDAGFYIGEITKDKVNLNRRSISDVSYKKITVNIEEFPNVVSALPFPRGREHLRLTLVGECEKPDIDELKTRLSPSYEELEISDKTTLPRDIWQGLGEDSLRGVFLRKMKERIEACNDSDEKEKLELAARFGIDAIENRDV